LEPQHLSPTTRPGPRTRHRQRTPPRRRAGAVLADHPGRQAVRGVRCEKRDERLVFELPDSRECTRELADVRLRSADDARDERQQGDADFHPARTVCQACQVMRRIMRVIVRPMIGSTISAPRATAPALAITPSETNPSARAWSPSAIRAVLFSLRPAP